MSRWADPRLRSAERLLTRGLGALGRILGRPDEPTLNRLTGRDKGGEGMAAPTVYTALAAGRRALADGRLGEALYQFELATRLDPEEPWAWHGRGDALQLGGGFADALLAYERALALRPELALSHNGRGNALMGLGRAEEAVAAWREAIRLDPQAPWPRESLSRIGERTR
jgi:tetratricopeptide (TPR) repeat protein